MNKFKPIGWRGDSYRHALAAKGITTKPLTSNKYFAAKAVYKPVKFFIPQDEARPTPTFLEEVMNQPLAISDVRVPVLDRFSGNERVTGDDDKIREQIQLKRSQAADRAVHDIEEGQTPMADVEIGKVRQLDVAERSGRRSGTYPRWVVNDSDVKVTPATPRQRKRDAQLRRQDIQEQFDSR